MEKHEWLKRFKRLLDSANISQFKIDWNLVVFHYRNGDTPEMGLQSVKENLKDGR